MDRNNNIHSDEPKDAIDTAPHAADWNAHEHQSDPVRMHAHQLVQETGSSELAKHLIDEVAHVVEADPHRTGFARGFGFESYLAMFEASTPLTAGDGRNWLVTTIPGGGWIAWNEDDLGIHLHFHTLEDAVRAIGAEGRQSGSDASC